MLRNILERLRNALEYRPWYTLSYGKLKLKLSFNPRKGTCLACGKKCWTNIHHWQYKYHYSEVRKQNRLALNYTTEVCYPDHQLAEAVRRLFDIDENIKLTTSNPIIKKLVELRTRAIKDGEMGWKKRV